MSQTATISKPLLTAAFIWFTEIRPQPINVYLIFVTFLWFAYKTSTLPLALNHLVTFFVSNTACALSINI